LSAQRSQPISIVGAGLAGSLLALLLVRRAFAITLYERRPDPRESQSRAGRSINLALAARGIRALERAQVMESIQPLLIAMRGRMLHDRLGRCELQPYGRTQQEVIYSVDRAALNGALLDAVTRYPQVDVKFEQSCLGVNLEADAVSFQDLPSGRIYEKPLAPTIAADGAGSAVRISLAAARAHSPSTTTTRNSPLRRRTAAMRSIQERCTSGRAAASC
jgi:kynurenine 3-monooxygenase